MLTLSVSHHIYLSREERYALADGKPLEVLGVSVPVWYFNGHTSEPANEVFCKYHLTNTKPDFPMTILAKGYRVNLPQVPENIKLAQRLPPDKWKMLPKIFRDQWKKANEIPPTGNDLRDEEDGGLGVIRFPRYNKILENNRRMNVFHSVEIQPIEVLEASL